MALLAAFLILLLWKLAVPLAAAQRKPGCRRQCGNVSVPYPFGIGARYHHGEGRGGFRLECDDTRHPPRLTVAGYGHEVVSISLAAAEATVLLNASRACYDRTPGSPGSGRVLLGRREYPMALNGSAFLFSSMKSKFVAIGCPDLAYFVDDGGYYVTGCMSVCRPSSARALPGSCRGDDGCCQSNIPLGLDSYRPYIRSFGRRQQQQGTFMDNSTSCAYAFMVDAWWFWYAGSHFNRTVDFAVPVVLDWAIRAAGAGSSCATARENATAYACRSEQSICLDSSNGPGYICNCTTGYEGNPYVLAGCKDVDECAHNDLYPCYGVRINTPGSYLCTCPKGSSGNATVLDGCHQRDKFTLALKAVTAVADRGRDHPGPRPGRARKFAQHVVHTVEVAHQFVVDIALFMAHLQTLARSSFWLPVRQCVTGVSIGVFLVILVCFSAHLSVQKRRMLRAKRRFFEQNGGLLLQQQLGSLASSGVAFKIFSEEEIRKATGNFDEARVLGRGGNGVVYRGVIADDGSTVAIKKSRVADEKQLKEFSREMLILSQINHRNVVKLLGCCLEVEVPMLVYEYVPNGSLHRYIHGGGGKTKAPMPPAERLRIAAESAHALAYMHSSASPPILHGDVKSANILLDGDLTAKVSDFGASRLAPAADKAQVATLVQGTCGYLDPEYLLTCQLTCKSDVYSFAVVLLELLTGRKAFCPDGPEEDDTSLAFCFVTAVQAGRHREIMDRNVTEELGVEVLDDAAELVIRCLSLTGEERPTMTEVADKIDRLRSCACRNATV